MSPPNERDIREQERFDQEAAEDAQCIKNCGACVNRCGDAPDDLPFAVAVLRKDMLDALRFASTEQAVAQLDDWARRLGITTCGTDEPVRDFHLRIVDAALLALRATPSGEAAFWAWRVVWRDGSAKPSEWHITDDPRMSAAVPYLTPGNCTIECIPLYTHPAAPSGEAEDVLRELAAIVMDGDAPDYCNVVQDDPIANAYVRLASAVMAAVEHATHPAAPQDGPSGEAWPPRDVLAKLADAADILLGPENYDGHGYEEINAARDAARRWLAAMPSGEADEYRHLSDNALLQELGEIAGCLDGDVVEEYDGLSFEEVLRARVRQAFERAAPLDGPQNRGVDLHAQDCGCWTCPDHTAALTREPKEGR